MYLFAVMFLMEYYKLTFVELSALVCHLLLEACNCSFKMVTIKSRIGGRQFLSVSYDKKSFQTASFAFL